MKKFRTHYDNLNIARNADIAVIKAAYKALAQKYHPDRNPDNPNAQKIMQIINKAYEILSDPIKRAEHDRWIAEQERNAEQSYQNTNNTQYFNTNQNKPTNSSFNNHSNEYPSQDTNHHSNGYQSYHDYTNNKKSSYPTEEHSKDNDKSYAGSWFGTWLVPLFTTILLSKVLFSIGFSIGFFGFLLSWVIYYICYSYTYDAIKFHKIIKELFAIIAGITAVIALAFILLFIADFFYKKPKNNTSTDNREEVYKPTQANNTSNNIIMPNLSNEPHPDPKNILAESKNNYDNAVANINAAWNRLHPSTQEFLRAEQRAINKKRETNCTNYGNAQSANKDLAMAYRYACEVPQLNERTEYLKTQLNTVVTPSTTKNVNSTANHHSSALMIYYNNPEIAPQTYQCQGNILCNAFVALANQWQSIPVDYRYDSFDIRKQAEEGDGYGLYKGYTLNNPRSIELSETGESFFYYNNDENNEIIFARGLAILLYLEDVNNLR